MPKLKQPKYINLADALRKTISAHQAVIEGIATHAEKHRVEMDAKRDRMHVQQSLSQDLPHANT